MVNEGPLAQTEIECVIRKQTNDKLRGHSGFDACCCLVVLVQILHLLHRMNLSFMFQVMPLTESCSRHYNSHVYRTAAFLL